MLVIDLSYSLISYRFVGGKPEVIFSPNDTLSGKITGEEKDIPKDHQFFLTRVTNQSLNILAEGPSGE